MSAKYAEIGGRLKEFCDKNFASRKDAAVALKMSYMALTNYITGQVCPGNKLQQKLRDLGCDIEWLMTGKTNEDQPKKHDTLISYSGTPTPEMKKRIERLAEWMANASEEDGKMLEQVARKILKGDA